MAIAIQTGTPGTPGTDSGGSASVTFTIPSTVPDGALIIAIHCNDFYGYANMVAPTLSFGTPTMNFLGGNDGGANFSHVKVWAFDYPAGASGTARTLTCTETGTHDEDKGLSVYALTGAAAAASCLDGSLVASGSPSASQSSHVFTGVTTAQSGSLLIAHERTSGGAGGVTFTAPGSMLERYDVANFTQFTGATETLAGTGATGTRTFTPSGSVPWVGVLFAIAPAAAGGAPVWLPIGHQQRRAPARALRSRTTAPPLATATPAPQAGQDHRTRTPPPRARARIETPVRAQVNPPYPVTEDAQPRRLRGLPGRRDRAVMPPWPQQAAPVNPDWIPAPRRPRQTPELLRREHIWMPPWPQQAAPAAPLWIPAERRPRPTPILARRDRGAQPPAPDAPWLPPGRRLRPLEVPTRRDRGSAPPAPAAPWLPAERRPRLVPGVRPRHQERLVLPFAAPPVNPTIVLLQPHHRTLMLPVRRRGRVFMVPLVGASPTECKVHRPFTGIVARGATGTVTRPYIGVVEFCTCCT